jgi:predicted permease
MPDWPEYVRRHLRLRGFRPEREAEIVEELARQMEDACSEALRMGSSEEQAAEIARQHISDWQALTNALADAHHGKEPILTAWQQQTEDRELNARGNLSWFTGWRRDVIYGLRLLAKNPGFTAVTVFMLALCIGGNSAIFSVINTVMFKALPVRDPSHLMLLEWTMRSGTGPKLHSHSSFGDCDNHTHGTGQHGCSLSKPFLDEVREHGPFASLAEFAGGGPVTVSGIGGVHRANPQYVSGDYFRALGVGAALGRVLIPADDNPGAPAVVVLTNGYWQRQFGGDPSVVGKTLNLNGVSFTVAGVADAGFTYLTPGNVRDFSVALWQRRNLQVAWKWTPSQEDAGSWWIVSAGRLKPGVSVSAAESQLSSMFAYNLLHAEKPIAKAEDGPAIKLLPAQTALSGLRSRISTMLYVLMIAVAIVLLIGCANVAGLLLARAAARQKEIAVRLALGAARARLVRQLLTESITLSLMGGALGILLAYWGARWLVDFAVNHADSWFRFSADIDWRVLGFTLAAAVLTGLLFGIAPALQSMRVDLTPSLKDSAGGLGGRQGRFRLGNILVIAQVALTAVVMVGAGLVVHTLRNLRSLDPGFTTGNLLTFQVDAMLTGYKDERMAAFYRDLRDRFAAIPGVTAVSYSYSILLSGSNWSTDFHLPGTPPRSTKTADYMPVGPQFFETMKIPLLRGRKFKPEEYELTANVEADKEMRARVAEPVIVNEAFVRDYFPNVNPIGQPFGAYVPGVNGDPSPDETASAGWQIVGVVRDAKYESLRSSIAPTIYVPAWRGSSFELRTSRDPMALASDVRAVVRQAGNDIPVVEMRTQTETIERELFQERLVARLASLFGLVALLLAAIGLYGLLAHEVTRSTREIGIRVALGSPTGQVTRRVVQQGVMLAAAGLAIGAAASLALTRLLGSMLFEVKAGDPVTLIGVSLLLMLVAVAACYIPAHRASRVDPLVALRHE